MNGFQDSHERPYGEFICVWLYDHVCVCTSLNTSLNLTAVSRPPSHWPPDIIWDNEQKDTWSLDSLTPLSLSVCSLPEFAISQLTIAPTTLPDFFFFFSDKQSTLLQHCWNMRITWRILHIINACLNSSRWGSGQCFIMGINYKYLGVDIEYMWSVLGR